jgi:hypothetical protein
MNRISYLLWKVTACEVSEFFEQIRGRLVAGAEVDSLNDTIVRFPNLEERFVLACPLNDLWDGA